MCDLIAFIVFPNMELYVMFVLPIGRIYTNVSAINIMNVCRTMS